MEAEKSSDTPNESHVVLLPIKAQGNHTVEGINFVPSSWGAPLVTALQGEDENGEPWIGIANETPLNWLRLGTPISKPELEILHLQRLATDHRLATGRELYDAIIPVSPGKDPPDIYACIGETKIGWELTAFSNSSRRQAQALFFEVAKRLIDQQRWRTGHLTGYHISMWFGAADDPAGLPFRSSDQIAYDRLIEALVSHQPNPTQYRVPEGQLPAKLVGFEPVRTADDVSFMSIPLLGGAPASALFAMTGMSVGLAFQSDHTASQEWASLRKSIERKDNPVNDRLLISVGAPDVMGRCFVGEEVLALFMLEHAESVSANHLSSVIMHFWSTGQAVELLGDSPVELWPRVYQGCIPAVHPFLPQV